MSIMDNGFSPDVPLADILGTTLEDLEELQEAVRTYLKAETEDEKGLALTQLQYLIGYDVA
jgi:predicted RNase H-like HicB family nuclease